MDKNTKLAFFLIALVIIFYPMFMPKTDKVPENNDQTHQVVPVEETPVIQKTDTIYLNQETEQLTVDTNKVDLYIQPEEKLISIETSLFSAKISNVDGVIKSWKIKKYKSRDDSTKLVDLIYEGSKNFDTEISLNNGKVLSGIAGEYNFASIDLSEEVSEGELILKFNDNLGNTLYTKSYKFYNDNYSFDVSIDTSPVFTQLSDKDALKMNWKEGLQYTEVSDNGKNLNREEWYRESYVKYEDEEVLDFDDNDDSEKISGRVKWGSTRTKYFEMFIYKKEGFFDSFINYPSMAEKGELYTGLGLSLLENKGTDPIKRFSVYFGPMDYKILKTYDMDFESTMNWGWAIVKPFSLGIYHALTFLHRFIDNYGIVIIVLSLLVNTLVLPFTLKSYKSQAQMKKIQPYIQEIKVKYKGDMQRQQQATMDLYKKHGVNPFGSCLPTLIPMPILYGMFVVFGATLEFRGADFALWITDLSLPEILFSLPFSIPMYGSNVGLLPIIMAVTMFLQMKEMPGADPNQKMMKYFMPVFMLVFFNNLASGLILYYTIGNFYRVVQQKLIKSEK